MEFEPKRDCAFKERAYSHRALVCNIDRCMECKDGRWQEEVDWSSLPPRTEVHVLPDKEPSELR